MCRELVVIEAFKYKRDTKERGDAWAKVADLLNRIERPAFSVDQRSVREHITLLEKRHWKKGSDDKKTSGISPLETELDMN